MSKIKIVTDSSVQLTPDEIKKYDIHVIPLNIIIDGKSYVDGETIQRDEFMDKMANAKELPKTSQPSIGQFVELYNDLTKDGSEVLSIHMTKSISGTVDAARQAADMADGKVTVVDSDFTDRAQAFQVLEAAKLAEEGKSMEDIKKHVTHIRDNTQLYMGVVNLNNLVKGGRLSKAAGFLTNILNIKIMLELKDASLNILKKGRGMKTITNFVNDLDDRMKNMTDIQAIGISYAGQTGKELVQGIKEQLQSSLKNVPILVQQTGPVIATHAGEGAFAIMFYTK